MAKDREGVWLSTGPQRVDMPEGLNKNSRSLHLSCLENQYFPSWWHQTLLTRRKPFVKWVLHGTELPLHQNLIYWPSPTASLEQSPRAIWGAASQLQSLFCPQIKLILPLSWHRKKLCIFLVDGYSVQWRDPQWTYLLLMNSTRNQSFGTSSGLLRECRQIWVSLSWFLNIPYWLRFWFYLVVSRLPPPPGWKETGAGACVKYPGQIHSWSRHWVGLGWKIPRNSHPGERYWVRGCLKDARNTHPLERYWRGSGSTEKKKSMITGGSAEKCCGHSDVWNWVILDEWLGKRLIWHLSSIWLPL